MSFWSFSDDHVSIFVCCLWSSVLYFVSSRCGIKGACSESRIHVLGLWTIYVVLSELWPCVKWELGQYFVLSIAWRSCDDRVLRIMWVPFSVARSEVKHFWTTWWCWNWLVNWCPFCKDSMQNDGSKSWQPQSHRIQEGKSRSCSIAIFQMSVGIWQNLSDQQKLQSPYNDGYFICEETVWQ